MIDLTTANLAIITAVVAAISSLVTVIVSSLFTIWNTALTRKYELRKQRQQLAIQSAIESWKKIFDLVVETSKVKQQLIWAPPLDVYILRMVKIAELAEDLTLTESNAKKKLQDIDKLLDAVNEYLVEKDQKLQRRT